MSISLYKITVLTSWILTSIGLYIMYLNDDWLWLIPMWVMIRFNHTCLSLHHRLISHRSFEAGSKFKHNLIIFLSVFQVNHSPLKFAISHRHHHKNSDLGPELDVHGPSTGFWNTLIGWELTLETRQRVLQMKLNRDLLRDKFLLWFDKHYYKILFFVFLIIFLVSPSVFWYIVVPASVFWKLEANLFVNWYCHKFGYTTYKLDTDTSHNSVWAGYLTMGEGWHNNHHANPGSWRLGQQWWELDIPAALIKHYFIK